MLISFPWPCAIAVVVDSAFAVATATERSLICPSIALTASASSRSFPLISFAS